MADMIERLLMSRTFRRYIEAWCVVLMPWVLFTEQEGVTMDGMFPLAKVDWDTPLCLICGASKPCELDTNKDNDPKWPGSPCTFDPPLIDYDYERDRLEREFTLTPEEAQEMEDRREVWNEDDWRESPTDNCDDPMCRVRFHRKDGNANTDSL